jgi:hypothetical protein
MKTFSEFLEESYLVLERNRYDDSRGFDRRLSKDERDQLEITYSSPEDIKHVERHFKSMGRDVPYEPGHTTIHHKPSGITYEIRHHRSQNEDPKKVLTGRSQKVHGHKERHELQWYPTNEIDTSHLPMGRRVKYARDAERVWHQHIFPRIPSGSLIINEPANEKLKKGYRARGFGNTTSQSNVQHAAKIGNKIHPVQHESFEISEDYKRLPRLRMMMRALKNFNRMRGHAIKAGTVGPDTTEGQIERYKAGKASKRASTIAAIMMTHDRNRSLSQDVANRAIGVLKKYGNKLDNK